MKKNTWLLAMAFAIPIGLGQATLLLGQSESRSVDDRVATLERELHAVKNRVAALENRSLNVTGITANRAAWRKIKTGMSQDDIIRVLGEPKRTEALSFTGTLTWYYGSGELDSRVMFDIKTNKVQGWTEPK